jgi:endonuclease/exonuclease/phosphatase family metal-dependent hydrolase
VRVLTWNVNCFNPGRRFDKRTLLNLEPWDIALLQEVRPDHFDAFTEAGFFTGISAVDLAGGSWDSRAHGAAVLVREPWEITGSGLLPVDVSSVENPEWLRARGIWATIAGPSGEVTVASAHMRNAANGEVEAKMAHYRSLAGWISTVTPPLVLGMDANTWNEWVEPAPSASLDDSDPFAEEHRFVSAGASHGLLDVLVRHLTENRPDLLERRRILGAIGEDGALEVTYERSRSGHTKVNRMDRIYASPVLAVTDVRTLYSDALTVGSDHAMVIADLK